ncbi:hypothetical protein SAMN05216207_10895 [Pseudonocardia ammonioxydans]|uniref:BFN domain-containing protein n=1 Tax=Pseudonocardia ammonioxydans TaxID=260086 RepID=A0A1I5I6I8_PSUAM|nr:bifunctional nuclease family protein [Pseudonocardia ammonioxydans]SFO56183.1 hypothetical protein SAMN05216207_10895 [Pseudonocardia ammonioxydans]
MIALQLRGMGWDAARGQPLVLLEEHDPLGRVLPIWIAEADATALEQAHQGLSAIRPGTHELIAAVLAASGRHLTRIVITALHAHTYYAELVLDDYTRVSARPSDALTLALRAGADIAANESVLDAAAVPAAAVLEGTAAEPLTDPGAELGPDQQVDLDRFREFLTSATPEDFDVGPDEPSQ